MVSVDWRLAASCVLYFMCRCFRDLVAKEENLEIVLSRAFVEVDKAFARHLHFDDCCKYLKIRPLIT